MTDEYACPKRNECGMYNNSNPSFSGGNSPFRGVGVSGDHRGLKILDPPYRLVACEGKSGVPRFNGCQHYELLLSQEKDDLGFRESFLFDNGVDVSNEEEVDSLDGAVQIITTEDGCGGNLPRSQRPTEYKPNKSISVLSLEC